MMDIIEEVVVEFNADQRKTRSVENTFRFSGQDPWVDCEKEFKNHLDSLSKLPLYKTAKSVADVLTDRTIETNTPAELPGEDGIQTLEERYEAGEDKGDKDDKDGDEEMKEKEEKEENWGEAYEGDRVAKEVGGKVYFGTVMKFGYIEKDGKDVDAWSTLR